jgi:hypothetical protein
LIAFAGNCRTINIDGSVRLIVADVLKRRPRSEQRIETTI